MYKKQLTICSQLPLFIQSYHTVTEDPPKKNFPKKNKRYQKLIASYFSWMDLLVS